MVNSNSVDNSQPMAKFSAPAPTAWKRWAAGAILVAGGVLLVGPRWLNPTAPSQARPTATDVRAMPVSTLRLKPVSSYQVKRTYTGEIKANRASDLGFEQGGKLVWLGVKAGDRVAPGTPIARLDTQNLQARKALLSAQKRQAQAILQELRNGPRQETIAAAKSRVADLEDRFNLEKIKRSRREYLYQEGAISKEQLDEISFGKNALQDQIAAAQSQVNELQNGTRPEKVMAQQAVIQQIDAQIADLNITINKSTLTAPFSGIISERKLDEGSVASNGQAIVRLIENANPEVEIGLPSKAIANVQAGNRYNLTVGAKEYSATLTAIKPEINTATRTQTIVLKLETSAVQQVAPKQIARLDLNQIVKTQGFWIPTAALIEGNRGLWACYVVSKPENGQTKVEKRDVEVLYTAGDRALIRGMVEADERVVAQGVQRLVNGQTVQPSN